MSKTLSKIASRPWVAHIDDERAEGNSIIVTVCNPGEIGRAHV